MVISLGFVFYNEFNLFVYFSYHIYVIDMLVIENCRYWKSLNILAIIYIFVSIFFYLFGYNLLIIGYFFIDFGCPFLFQILVIYSGYHF